MCDYMFSCLVCRHSANCSQLMRLHEQGTRMYKLQSVAHLLRPQSPVLGYVIHHLMHPAIQQSLASLSVGFGELLVSVCRDN